MLFTQKEVVLLKFNNRLLIDAKDEKANLTARLHVFYK